MSVKQAEHDFGEATVTSKGQITVPNDLRKARMVSGSPREVTSGSRRASRACLMKSALSTGTASG